MARSRCSTSINRRHLLQWNHRCRHSAVAMGRCNHYSSIAATTNRMDNDSTHQQHMSTTTNNKNNTSSSASVHPIQQQQQPSIPTTPLRISSREAASLITNCTSTNDGLLVITCDASGRGGGSKHDGIASVLRLRHGSASVGIDAITTIADNTAMKQDLIDTTSRRTVPSRKSSEVAAISLGIKRALRVVPPTMRRRVLILSDSEFALDFFCGDQKTMWLDVDQSYNGNVTVGLVDRRVAVSRRGRASATTKRKKRKGTISVSKNKRRTTQDMAVREEAHRRSLFLLMKDAPECILFSKVRSSSRSVGKIVSNNDGGDGGEEGALSAWDGCGFVDHDAADYLSSVTRSTPNTCNDEGVEYNVHGSSSMLNTTLSFRAVECLGADDIEWLENSDQTSSEQTQPFTSVNAGDGDEERSSSSTGTGESSEFWRTITVQGSDAREDRRKRNDRKKERILEMLQLKLE